MSLKKLTLVLCAIGGSTAIAQAPIGTVVNVNGVVTAVQGGAGVSVAPGSPIQNGTRLVTTANGSVTFRMSSGCTVTVPPGHGVTILSTLNCPQLTAAVQPVVPVAAAPAVAPGNAVLIGAGALVAAGVIAGAVDDDDNSLSGQ